MYILNLKKLLTFQISANSFECILNIYKHIRVSLTVYPENASCFVMMCSKEG